jgi:NitT/TauT family transport system substrate-binding protein
MMIIAPSLRRADGERRQRRRFIDRRRGTQLRALRPECDLVRGAGGYQPEGSFLMSTVFSRRARGAAFASCLALALAWTGRAAFADDSLTVLGGTTSPSFFDVEDMVAQQSGLFAAEHLNVNKQFVGSASTCIQLVSSGKGDICTSSVEPVIQGYDKGIRLQMFLNRDPRYDYVLAVLNDSPIRTLADFKGKTLGEVNIGSTSEISTDDMVQGAGLRKSDLAFIPISTGPQAMSAIGSHKVDGVSFPSVELGTYTVVAHQQFRIWRDPILNDVPNVGFLAAPATIASKSDQLRRYARAMVEAAILIRENPTVAARDYLTGSGQKVTPEAVQTTSQEIVLLQGDLPGADPGSKRIGYMPLNGIEIYAKFLNAAGFTKSVVPASEIVTNQFIAYANDFDHNAFIAKAKAMK